MRIYEDLSFAEYGYIGQPFTRDPTLQPTYLRGEGESARSVPLMDASDLEPESSSPDEADASFGTPAPLSPERPLGAPTDPRAASYWPLRRSPDRCSGTPSAPTGPRALAATPTTRQPPVPTPPPPQESFTDLLSRCSALSSGTVSACQGLALPLDHAPCSSSRSVRRTALGAPNDTRTSLNADGAGCVEVEGARVCPDLLLYEGTDQCWLHGALGVTRGIHTPLWRLAPHAVAWRDCFRGVRSCRCPACLLCGRWFARASAALILCQSVSQARASGACAG